MREIIPNNDLTNPDLYHKLTHPYDTIVVELPYDMQYVGVIHKTLSGFDIEFSKSGKYFICDSYSNCLYLSNYKNRDKVIEFYNSIECQFCEDLDEMFLLICEFFDRTKSKLYKQIKNNLE